MLGKIGGKIRENAGKIRRNMENLGKLEGQKAEHAGKIGGTLEENIGKNGGKSEQQIGI